MNSTAKWRGAVLVALLAVAVPARADPGLAYAAMFQMVVLNLLFGVIEGLALAWMFRLRKWRTIGIMIVANYASSWFGALLMAGSFHWAALDIENALRSLWEAFAVSYALALVLEYPFVWFAIPKGGRRKIDAVKGSLVVQTLTYLLLFGFYASFSDISLVTQGTVVAAKEADLPPRARLFFISAEDGDVYGGLVRDRHWIPVFKLGSDSPWDRLVIRSELDGSASLVVDRYPEPTVAKPAVSWDDEPEWHRDVTDRGERDVVRLGAAADSPWTLRIGFYYLGGSNSVTRETFRLGFSTPLATWRVSNVTQLPDDKVVFQLGDDQICLLDPKTRKVALLARGWGPAVVLDPDDADRRGGHD